MVQVAEATLPSLRESGEAGDVPIGKLADFKEASAVGTWSKEPRSDVLRVLRRAADDPDFIAQLTYRGSEALAGYHLTWEEKAALLSGNILWIQRHVGKLDEQLETWLWCRLSQEIW